MNCKVVQDRLTAAPAQILPQIRAHLEDCADCRAVQAGIERLDAKVIELLRAPRREGLKARIVLASRLQTRPWPSKFAIAASLLVVIGATFAVWRSTDNAANLEWGTVMAQHVIDDPQHERMPDPDAANGMRHSLAELGLASKNDLPPVLRAGLCQLQDQMAAHLVFEVDGERVVAIVLPQGTKSGSLEYAGWAGQLETMDDRTIAVFALDPARAKSFSAALMKNLQRRHG